jgi:hypothetical protein
MKTCQFETVLLCQTVIPSDTAGEQILELWLSFTISVLKLDFKSSSGYYLSLSFK